VRILFSHRHALPPNNSGIGPNRLLARLATKRAKPNGQSVINPEEARAVLGDLEVDALPGVGWSLRNKLKDMGITHVRQVPTRFGLWGLESLLWGGRSVFCGVAVGMGCCWSHMLLPLEVDALPGVGWSLRNKLKHMGITHVRQVCL
jgi:nucleotidyltransferase/DNA polymerase involved in DNA repair